MLMHISFQQRNVRLFRKDAQILRGQCQELVIFSEMEKIVTKIDNHVPVSWQHFDCFPANFGRFLILAVEAEVSLFLSKDLRLLVHFALNPTQPCSSQAQIMRFDCGVHSPCQNQRVPWGE